VRQLVILSGKGGTGKTSVAAAFAHLACHGTSPVQAVLADADVDAANLELVLQPRLAESHEFIGGVVAWIDPGLCEGCGICAETCRFDAVLSGEVYRVDPIACEGCAACVYDCPTNAIRMEPQVAGRWFRSDTRYGPLFHAELKPAQENSGKLVTLVKQQARLHALDGKHQALIVDGPPGIGCPVISAISGADLALIVAEPSLAGVSDMQRALQTTAHFRIQSMVCINKDDIYPAGAEAIETYCRGEAVETVGRIPYDEAMTEAMVCGEPVTLHSPLSPASVAIASMWERLAARLNHEG
jgi:MinD superfamily P-loop ATPase